MIDLPLSIIGVIALCAIIFVIRVITGMFVRIAVLSGLAILSYFLFKSEVVHEAILSLFS